MHVSNMDKLRVSGRERIIRNYKNESERGMKIFEKVEWMESTEGKSFDEKS